MYILLFILVLLSGIIAIKLRFILFNEQINCIKGMFQFAKYVYLITFFILCVLYLRGWGTFAFEWISVTFALKYAGLSLIFALLLPIADYLIFRVVKNARL